MFCFWSCIATYLADSTPDDDDSTATAKTNYKGNANDSWVMTKPLWQWFLGTFVVDSCFVDNNSSIILCIL